MRISGKAEPGRVLHGLYGSRPGEAEGAFSLMGPCGAVLVILAGNGKPDGSVLDTFSGWEHVSVSTARRIPNWLEMCWVKDLFWEAEDCVVQYHPPKSRYVNRHPNVLHLWRPVAAQIPMPPLECV